MVEWKKVHAILFDLDGLMVDSEPHSLRSWRVILASRHVELAQSIIDRMFGLRQIEAAQMLVTEYRLADDPVTLAREKETYQITHLQGQIVPMPGLLPLLEALPCRGFRSAVASSGARPYVEAVLQAIHVTQYFHACISGDDVARGKPAPDIFLAAARHLNVDPSHCLVLEDAPAGIQAAKAALMQCIAVPNDHTRSLDLSGADLIVPSLNTVRDELTNLAER